jgi:hypothetical protein
MRAPVLVLSVCALLTILAAVAAKRLFPVETDILALLPNSAPEAVTFRNSLRQFGSFDYLVVVVEAIEPKREKILTEVASHFADAVRDYGKFIQSVEYAPNAKEHQGQLPEISDRLVPALLTKKQLDAIESIVHRKLDKQLGSLHLRLLLTASPERRRELLDDPLGLKRIVQLDRVYPWGPIQTTNRSGLAISEDGQMLLMVLKPRERATDLRFSEELMRWLRDVARYAIAVSGPEASLCQIGFIGSHAEAENDALVVRRDLAVTLAASFFLVVLLFIVAVRRISAVFFVGIPLAVGVIWTLGAARLFFNEINAVTCIFGAALVGLSVDYAIHLYNRYLEERMEGIEVAQALETALCETGHGVVIAALTTAVGFYGMYFTRFEALQELAIVGGTGILCCLAAMLLVLPPLVVLSERAPARLKVHTPPSSLGLGRFAATVQMHPRLTLLVGLIITTWLGFFAEHIPFDENIEHLREPPGEYQDLIRRLELRRFDLPPTQVLAIVSGPTREDALYRNDRLFQRLEERPSSFSLLGYDSLRTVLPSLRTQRESQARLRAILDLDAIKERVRSIAKKEDLFTTVAAKSLDDLARWKAAATDENVVRFGPESSPAFVQLVGQYVYSPRGRCRIVTHIYPRPDTWNESLRSAFISYLQPDNETLELTGMTFITDALKQALSSGMRRAVFLVALFVYLLLILHFRSARKAAVATIPVLCGVVWTLGTMQMLGMELNFLNVLAIPLILGLGIHDGVHILQRYYEGGRRDLESAVEQSGRAIVVTSLTTMLAFGTLSFANFRGIREIGLVAILGVGFALIASILLVPALLKLAGEHLRLIDLISGEQENHSSRRQ